MKKLAVVFAIIALASCGEAPFVEVKRVEAPWGSVGIPEGWVVKSQEGSNLTLESQLENFTQMTFRMVRKPDDLDGWAKSFIESSGRTLDKSSSIDVSDRNLSRYDMTALAGRVTLGEILVLAPVGDELLAINASWPTKSALAGVPLQMIKSIVFGGK